MEELQYESAGGAGAAVQIRGVRSALCLPFTARVIVHDSQNGGFFSREVSFRPVTLC